MLRLPADDDLAQPCGLARRGTASDTLRLRLAREHWAALRRPEVRVEGLEACLELFRLAVGRGHVAEGRTPAPGGGGDRRVAMPAVRRALGSGSVSPPGP